MSSNGALPATELSPIANGQLANDAAAAWNTMNMQARKRGVELRPTGSMSSYRTVAQQQELWNRYIAGTGNLAAKPGTSNHGWGLAVDLASQEMRKMVDQIGREYGWAKIWSDAPTEWWHIKYRAGVWSGPDPGPYGLASEQQIAIPEPPEDTVALAVATMKDGRFEVFVETTKGEVFHTWQAKEGGWAGAEKGKRNAGWQSLGTPGK